MELTRTIPGLSLANQELADKVTPSQHTTILLLYVGGTIGMKKDGLNGYKPVKNYLFERLSSMPQFHDSLYCADVLHKMDSHFNVAKQAMALPMLITPPSSYGKRIIYHILEYEELLDSSNMTMSDWIKIAKTIQDHYKAFDAFVVLHGTDTMAYTASALSFMLENLGKSVVITGSQIPLAELRNDACENLLGALTIAGHFIVPEVCIYFGNRLLRGNRSVKTSAIDFKAFSSPNLKPLVNVGVNLDVHWDVILRPSENASFSVQQVMDANVGTLRLFPGITEATVRAFLSPSIKGIVLETFGVGNAPNNRPDLLSAFQEASSRGVVIVNITQCKKGSVSDLYATGVALKQVGIVQGLDMTTECALTKLSYLLGKGYSAAQVRALIGTNLRGELTITKHHFSAPTPSILPFTQNSSFDPRAFSEFIRSVSPVLACKSAQSGDIDTLEALRKLQQMGSFNCFAEGHGNSPLHVAIENGNYRVVEYLVKNGSSVHVVDADGTSPLTKAVVRKEWKIAQLLIETGAYLESSKMLIDALFKAAREGDEEFIRKILIEMNCKIDALNEENKTLMHMAASFNRATIINMLDSLDPDMKCKKDMFGMIPADYARMMNYDFPINSKKVILYSLNDCPVRKGSPSQGIYVVFQQLIFQSHVKAISFSRECNSRYMHIIICRCNSN